jgi:hypothetical protein
MPFNQIKTASTQSVEYGVNGVMIPFNYVTYDIEKLYSQALINIYHGVVIEALEVGPNTPNGLNDIYDHIRLNTPNTEIILTEDPYDALGNIVRFQSDVDDSLGRDGDILISTLDYKMYKRENGIYVFKFQMQGGSGIAIAAQWYFSSFINNALGVDGDLLLLPGGQLYKKVNGEFVFQMTIVGQPGTNGINGTNGTKIFLTTTETYTGTAAENDINIVGNNNIYRMSSGIWVLEGSIKGATGLKGDKGDNGDSPEFFSTSSFDGTLGKDGDIVLDPADFKIYKKVLGVYVHQSTLDTPVGSVWHYNATKDDTIGVDGDFLIIDSGQTYERVDGEYVARVNLKGSNGTDGTDGAKIFFFTSIDNSLGVEGDILFVGNSIYQKDENDEFVLSGEIEGGTDPGTTGSGFKAWANLTNPAIVTYDSSQFYDIPLGKISSSTPSGIIMGATGVTISAGIWDIEIDITSDNCPYTLDFQLGSTIFFKTIINSRRHSIRRSIRLTASELLTLKIKGQNASNIPANNFLLSLRKIEDVTNGSAFSEYPFLYPDFSYIASTEAIDNTMPNDGGNATVMTTSKPSSGVYSGEETILGVVRKVQHLQSPTDIITIQGLSSAGFGFYGSNSWTVGLFIKISSLDSSSPILIWQNDSSCGESGIWASDTGTLSLISERESPCDTNGFTLTTSSVVFNLSEWFHLTVSYNGSDTYKVYVDNNEVISTVSTRIPISTVTNRLVINGVNNHAYGTTINSTAYYSTIRMLYGVYLSDNTLLSGATTRFVPETLDLADSPCSGTGSSTSKKIYEIDSSDPTTVVALSTTISDSDIVYINLISSSTIAFDHSPVDGKRVIIYFQNIGTPPAASNVQTTNLAFQNGVLQSDLIISNTANTIDMLGLEYSNSLSCWKVMTFVKDVY